MTQLIGRQERHLYIEEVPSGWRINRPSGWHVVRALKSRDEAIEILVVNGYVQYRGGARFDRNDIL